MAKVEDVGRLAPLAEHDIDAAIELGAARAQQQGIQRALDRQALLQALAEDGGRLDVERHRVDAGLGGIGFGQGPSPTWEADHRRLHAQLPQTLHDPCVGAGD